MYNKLEASIINQEPIENILNVLQLRWELKLEWNKISLDWHFSTKYRFDKSKNRVWAFNIEMHNGKPFNFVKWFYFSDLSEKEAIAETYSWFKSYYWINDEYTWDLKMSKKLLKKIEEKARKNKIKQEQEEKARLWRRKTFWTKFFKLKKYYSENILEYFQNRWISRKTLEKNNARTWIIFHNGKLYKNRVFFSMKDTKEIVWIKMRNINTYVKEYKSINIPDSWSWLLYNEFDLKGKDTVYLCEWEIDKLSLDEAWMFNSIWNMMWANTFSKDWLTIFKDVKNINILYDFDKNSLAWLQWVLKVIKNMPLKNIRFLDMPNMLEKNIPKDREILLRDFSDINDLWVSYLLLWKTGKDFQKSIDESLVKKSVDEISKIISWFKNIHKKEEEKNIWTFSLSFKSKIKSLDDFAKF